MKVFVRTFGFTIALSFSLLSLGFGADAADSTSSSKGPIREFLKERWIQRQNSKPAPKGDTAPDAKITKPGDYTVSFDHGGHTRIYKIHVPQLYRPETAAPLIVAFHGGGGNMEYQATDKFYNLISKSDKEGFVIVFPNGYSRLNSGKFATWNAGHCCAAARDENIDDVAFVREMIQKLTSQLNIDRKRIFATGMSNGGMMSYRLACELSDVFKAVASVAGTDNTLNCSPKNPISVLHIHAKNDTHVLFNGGSGKPFEGDKSKVTEFTSVPNTISKWVKLNGCDPKPQRTLEKAGAYCELYNKCKAGSQVQLCVTETGGHSWPGGEKPRGNESPSKAVSATDVIWDFFKTGH